MTLDEIRQKYPQYGDLSDQQLADALYQKSYSDMDRADFDRRIGLNAPPAERPSFAARAFRAVDDTVRSVASGNVASLADEFAAGMDASTAYGMDLLRSQFGGPDNLPWSELYDTAIAQERARDAEINPMLRIGGEIAGAVMTGTGLARGGLTVMNMARPTIGGMALRGAGEGAAYGAAYGFGAGEGAENRLTGAAFGAGVGAAGGALLGAGAGALNRPIPQSATNNLKAQASAAYQAADDAGVIISRQSVGSFARSLQDEMAEQGIDATLHPRALAALNRIMSLDDNVTLRGMEIIRRVAKSAAASNDPSERRLAGIIIDRLDNYVGGLGPDDVVAGNVDAAVSALQNARNLWMRGSKTEIVTSLIERANTRASQFSGSGLENALRTEFRQLAMNPARMRLFSPEEQAAIRRVSEGGTMTNLLRTLGKFAPTGVVSQVLAGGAGLAIGGPVGAVALPAAGMAARQGATAMTNRAAAQAANVMSGAGPAVRPTLTAQQQALLRSLVTGNAAVGGNAGPLVLP